MSAELVPAASTATPVPWDPEQLEILKRDLGIKNDQHLAYFAQVATHKGLDPFLGEITPIYFGGDMVIYETVEGLRTIAERSGLYGGFDGPYFCGPDGQWRATTMADGTTVPAPWLDDDNPPAAARYLVIRKDWTAPVAGIARWKSSVRLDRQGRPEAGPWRDRPDEMLGKTAEVRALRRAFPKEFARAGVNAQDLTDAQIVALEARQIGLDDNGRHALIAEVTGGRTESSRDLTDDEMIAVRSEIARRRPAKRTAVGPGGTETYWVDPATGEFVDPPEHASVETGEEVTHTDAGAEPLDPDPERTPPATGTAPVPGEEPPGYVDTDGHIHVPATDPANETERRRLIAELVPRSRALEPDARKLLHAWLDGAGIGSAKKVKDYTLAELRRTAEAITEFEKPLPGEEPF